MYCDQCGKEARVEAVYCSACGNLLTHSATQVHKVMPPEGSHKVASLPVERLITGIERVMIAPLRWALTAFLRWVGLANSHAAREATEIALHSLLVVCVAAAMLLIVGLLIGIALIVTMVVDALV